MSEVLACLHIKYTYLGKIVSVKDKIKASRILGVIPKNLSSCSETKGVKERSYKGLFMPNI